MPANQSLEQPVTAEVERVAILLWEAAPSWMAGCFALWNEIPETDRRAYRAMARAALSAMQDSGAIGELTQELIAIRVAALNGEDDALDAILAATERALYATKAKAS